MNFDPADLLPILERLRRQAQAPSPKRYCIAFSGGLDSRVLLQAMAELGPQIGDTGISLRVFHVDHGLSPMSRGWSQACEKAAGELGLEYHGLRVDAGPAAGESPEAAARKARYGALAAAMEPGDWLLLAHHQDDQAETLLLQLLRGAGPRGLAAMPAAAPFGCGWLMRPFLDYPRTVLQAYAEENGLTWIEDESNFDTGFDRNFLRHSVTPRLHDRWPGAAATLSRSAALCGEAAQLLEELADIDLDTAATDRSDALSITALLALGRTRLRNALAVWFRRLALPVPSRRHIDHLIEEVLGARSDAMPLMAWPGAEVRRYRDRVYAMAPLTPVPVDVELSWDLRAPLTLPGMGILSATRVQGQGLNTNGPVTICFRNGGERCRPAGRGGSHSLKKLFQEAAVPPWQRQRLPLLYIDGELAAVPGHFLCDPYQAGENETGWLVQWQESGPAEMNWEIE